jgi:general secretion pathway protein I
MKPNSRPGFTLLEVMISLAIVAVALSVTLEMQGMAALKTETARHITVATLLARGKILDVQQQLKEDGFGDFMKILDGDFEEEGFKEYRWIARVRKVEVPMPSAGNDVGSNPAEGSGGMSLGMLAPMLQSFGTVLEGAVREIEVRVLWQQGKSEDWVTVVTHVVNRDLLNSGLMGSGIPDLSSLQSGSGSSGQVQGGMPGLNGGKTSGFQGASQFVPSLK